MGVEVGEDVAKLVFFWGGGGLCWCRGDIRVSSEETGGKSHKEHQGALVPKAQILINDENSIQFFLLFLII